MFAFVFDSVSGGEWLVLLAVILIIVGPKNLPSTARKVGEVMSKLRRAADEFKRQLMTMDEEMRKTADDIKKEYIDIPEDASDKDITEISDASDDPYGYDPDDPDYTGEYPEEDHYGMDDAGDPVDSAEAESPSPDASSEHQQTETVSAAPVSDAAEAPEKSNG